MHAAVHLCDIIYRWFALALNRIIRITWWTSLHMHKCSWNVTINRINIKRRTIYINCDPFMDARKSTHTRILFRIRSMGTFMIFIHKITRLLVHDNTMHFSIELKPPVQPATHSYMHIAQRNIISLEIQKGIIPGTFLLTPIRIEVYARDFDRFRKRSTELTRMNFVCTQIRLIQRKIGERMRMMEG